MGVLAAHRVEYVLVGGIAAQAHAATRPTTDFDACLRWTAENRDRAAVALAELDAGYRVEGMSERFRHRSTVGRLLGWRSRRGAPTPGDIDYLSGIPTAEHGLRRLATYEDLAPRAQRMIIAGVPVDVASLPDIIDSKTVPQPTQRPRSPSRVDRTERRHTEAEPIRLGATRPPRQTYPCRVPAEAGTESAPLRTRRSWLAMAHILAPPPVIAGLGDQLNNFLTGGGIGYC